MKPDIINIDGCPLYLDKDLNHLKSFLTSRSYSTLIVLGDNNTIRHCYPLIEPVLPSQPLVLEFEAGEHSKTLATCETVWRQLLDQRIDRKALLILLGGGVTGDMGGFIAATYKRGLDFIHVPTTLMSMTDSSIGGKLGIDFDRIKNAIGLFRNPRGIFIHTAFLKTLPPHEMWSGLSEIAKHALIANNVLFRNLNNAVGGPIPVIDHEILHQSILVKKTLVERDPFESSVRKALNFGHTIGHAIESQQLASGDPLTHGEAVAFGMIAETYLSHRTGLILADHHEEIQKFLRRICNVDKIRNIDRTKIQAYILNDKKNESGKVLFSLLNGIGSFSINKAIEERLISESIAYLLN